MNRSTLAIAAAGLAAWMATGCHPTDPSGPPSIRLGRDECAGCGMLISEDRCSCAILVRQDGDLEYRLFDDLGCLLDYRADHPEAVVADSFVRDYGSGAWVHASAAWFLTPGPTPPGTPMGSGMVAFEGEHRANTQRLTSGGDIVRYDRLTEVRREGRLARHAEPGGTL